MIIKRDIANYVTSISKKYPVITITGPRQSGKTTLVKHLFSEKPYINLEQLESRKIAQIDPVGFLKEFKKGAVIDEIQRVPELLSEIQVIVDKENIDGMFVLTGSQNFNLLNSINQSLAGRTTIITLLPLSFRELNNHGIKQDWRTHVYSGGYPRIYNKNLNATTAMSDYFMTYVERDLRQLSAVHDLAAFEKFLKLCAGRTGQLLDITSIGNDAGVSRTTISNWLSILQASYILYLLQPYYINTGKRLIKTPKIYFYDTALAAFLLGIENVDQLKSHPLTGNLFENYVVNELIKFRFNNGKSMNLNFYMDSKRNEVDILYTQADTVTAIEIKSSHTFNDDFLKNFKLLKSAGIKSNANLLVYNGDVGNKINNIDLCNIETLINKLEGKN